jgi:hypothetical protein
MKKSTKLPETSVRYNNVRIDDISTEKFPDMVEIIKAPARLKSLIGKKFVTLNKAKIMIDVTIFDKKLKIGTSQDEKDLREFNHLKDLHEHVSYTI